MQFRTDGHPCGYPTCLAQSSSLRSSASCKWPETSDKGKRCVGTALTIIKTIRQCLHASSITDVIVPVSTPAIPRTRDVASVSDGLR